MILICPGVHAPQLTQSFLEALSSQSPNLTTRWLVFPASSLPYSAFDTFNFLRTSLGSPRQASPLLFISFSAGVVGAIGAAMAWQMQSGKIKGLIALDGWGVPLIGNFPIHRLSHDYFTYWSSALLGAGQDSFYADPAVEHLELWRSPRAASGWWIKTSGEKVRCCAAQFLIRLLQLYEEA